MKVLVLGAGQIAMAIRSAAPARHELIFRARADLDICDAEAVKRTLALAKADWIVNAAAYTAVDLAEDQKSLAISVNDDAVASLDRAASSNGSRLLHLSTDYVFDGQSKRPYSPADQASPINVYGSSKLGGERHVVAGGTGVVLRTSWVYAAQGKNFALTMLRLMRERPEINVVCDQIGAPTWAASAASAIWGLMEANAAPGIYHWSDLGVASWYDFAVAIQEEAVARDMLSQERQILPVFTNAYPTRAKRPPFSVLDSSSTRSLLGVSGTHWRRNLRMMLDELRTS